MEALRDCLAAAPESSRRLLKLRYFDGYRCEEVAREMGIALNAICKRLSRLHESLRQCVDGKLARTRRMPAWRSVALNCGQATQASRRPVRE